MFSFRDFATYVLVAFGSLSAVLLPTTASSQQVGTAAAVNPSAQARGTGGARTIVIGNSISHRERIQTTSAGSVQLLFLDKTSMTIGPNSDLAIDEYVYDPAANTGKLAATLTKGVMRFVGGQVSHSGNAQITTPGGVVGIRGGVGIIGTNQVFIGYGQGTVTGASQTVTLGAGDYTQTAPGAPPSNPSPPPPGLISNLLANFESQGGQGGGAPASSEGVNRARTVASGTPGGTIATAASASTIAAQTESQRAAPAAQTFTTVFQSVDRTRTNEVVLSLPPPAPPSPPPPAPLILSPTPVSAPVTAPSPAVVTPPQFTGPAFAFNMSNCCGLTGATSNAPYLPQTFATGDNRFISPVIGYRQTSNNLSLTNFASPANVSPTPFLQWGIDITGSGANQTSWFSVMTGTLVDNDNGVTLSGGFGATRRGAANQTMGRAFGVLSSTPGSVVIDDARIPLSATVNQQDYVAATNHYRNVQAQFSPTGISALTNFAFTQQLTRTSAPTGLGLNRPGEVLTGWTGGLMQTVNGSSATTPFATIGTAQIILDPTLSRVQATFDVVNATPGSLDSLLFASFRLGSVNPSRPAQSAYVDRDNFAAREAVSLDGAQQIQQSSVNGQRPTSSTTIMVNVPRNVAQTILPGTTICECDYTRWGFWSTDTRRSGLFGGSRADQGHLMTWVAGQLPNAGDVPSTGTATYDGHVVANVRNGSAQYVAAGNMTNTINFGSRSGSAQVNAFDGANYSGTLLLDRNDPRYLGAGLSSNVGNRTMIMTGNLFRGAQSPVGEMGGNVLVGGSNYLGSGIFAGRMR
jgi:hypothetical protein